MSELEGNAAQTMLDAGRDLAGIQPRIHIIEHDGIPVPVALVETDECAAQVHVLHEVMAAAMGLQSGPQRREGVHRFTEADSFCDYVKRYATKHALVYADTTALGFTVVLDEHPPGEDVEVTAWRAHRAQYTCPRSPEWITWTALDGQPMPQEKFADFIESRLEDLTSGESKPEGYPMPTDVLKMARDLLVLTKGTYQRQINPTTGAGILVCKTETDTGSTQIPRAFLLAIPVFEGGTRYQVEARVRFELKEGRPQFMYQLHRRKEIERDAFLGLRQSVASATALPVLAGSP